MEINSKIQLNIITDCINNSLHTVDIPLFSIEQKGYQDPALKRKTQHRNIIFFNFLRKEKRDGYAIKVN